jgi:hypothetical protein
MYEICCTVWYVIHRRKLKVLNSAVQKFFEKFYLLVDHIRNNDNPLELKEGEE